MDGPTAKVRFLNSTLMDEIGFAQHFEKAYQAYQKNLNKQIWLDKLL